MGCAPHGRGRLLASGVVVRLWGGCERRCLRERLVSRRPGKVAHALLSDAGCCWRDANSARIRPRGRWVGFCLLLREHLPHRPHSDSAFCEHSCSVFFSPPTLLWAIQNVPSFAGVPNRLRRQNSPSSTACLHHRFLAVSDFFPPVIALPSALTDERHCLLPAQSLISPPVITTLLPSDPHRAVTGSVTFPLCSKPPAPSPPPARPITMMERRRPPRSP